MNQIWAGNEAVTAGNTSTNRNNDYGAAKTVLIIATGYENIGSLIFDDSIVLNISAGTPIQQGSESSSDGAKLHFQSYMIAQVSGSTEHSVTNNHNQTINVRQIVYIELTISSGLANIAKKYLICNDMYNFSQAEVKQMFEAFSNKRANSIVPHSFVLSGTAAGAILNHEDKVFFGQLEITSTVPASAAGLVNAQVDAVLSGSTKNTANISLQTDNSAGTISYHDNDIKPNLFFNKITLTNANSQATIIRFIGWQINFQ